MPKAITSRIGLLLSATALIWLAGLLIVTPLMLTDIGPSSLSNGGMSVPAASSTSAGPAEADFPAPQHSRRAAAGAGAAPCLIRAGPGNVKQISGSARNVPPPAPRRPPGGAGRQAPPTTD